MRFCIGRVRRSDNDSDALAVSYSESDASGGPDADADDEPDLESDREPDVESYASADSTSPNNVKPDECSNSRALSDER